MIFGHIIHRFYFYFFASLIFPFSIPCPLFLVHSHLLVSGEVCGFCRVILFLEAQTSFGEFMGREEKEEEKCV